MGGDHAPLMVVEGLEISAVRHPGARFLLLYDPTRGVDVATKFEIYKLIQALADEGRSMLVYSSDLAEVVGLCDRVLTFYRSRVTGEFSGEDLTENNVLSAIVGHQGAAA